MGMRFFINFVAALTVCLSISLAAAQDKVVVIPLNSAKKLNNVVTVSTKGGDFTSPVAAVNSITDAAEAKPYLVLIGPGVYTLTQTLVMKPFVTIAGSGRDATILTGAISTGIMIIDANSALVSGADNATLCDLTIKNTGGGVISMALYNDGSSPAIRDVTARASGAIITCGMYSKNSSSPIIMTDVTATASGGEYAYGVYNYNNISSPTMTNMIASASGGTVRNSGVVNDNSSPFMTNVTAAALGIVGEKIGVHNFAGSNPFIRHSLITAVGPGTYHGIKVSAGTVRVAHSSIIGGVDFPAAP